MPHISQSEPNDADLALLADLLLPGRDGAWPKASAVLSTDQLGLALKDLSALTGSLSALSPREQLAQITAAQSAYPQRFAQSFGALTDAYYSTPEAQSRIKALASSAPWPASGTFFDPALLLPNHVGHNRSTAKP